MKLGFFSTGAQTALAIFALCAVSSSSQEAVAHGNTIDLSAYCRMINDRGGIKLPTDAQWRAQYNTRKKRWDCVRPQSYGFGKVTEKVVQPLNLVKACRKWGGSRKVHYHEGMNVKAASSVHCGKFDGTVKRGGGHGQKTTLRMCNRSSSSKVSGAYAYWDRAPGRRGWTTDGWWTIARGECKQLTVKGGPSGKPYTGDIYVFGINPSGSWGGDDARFCIDHRENFTFTTADKRSCRGGNLRKVGMTKFAVKPGPNTWNFR